MSFIVAHTSRIGVGVSVLIMPYRNPVATAKSLATVDRIALRQQFNWTATAVCSGLQKLLWPLVPAAAPSSKSAAVSMTASLRSKLSRNAKKPIQSGASVGRRRRSRVLFARGDGFVQQHPDFLASDVVRPTGLAQIGAHFICRYSEEFPFQGVKQRR